MRRACALVLLLALAPGCGSLFRRPAWELPPPPPRDAPVVDAAALERTVLPNGVEAIVLEDHRLPRLSLGVTVRRGADLEGLGQAGLAAFMAELMERGAGERDALALAGVVDRLGASLSAGADWDSVTVSVSGLSRDLDTLFGVLRDVVLKPRFDADEAARVRAEQLAELESAKDDPSYLARIYLAALLYPQHRYGLPVGGTRETVARLDAGQARALHARLFVPANAILHATGDVDAVDLLDRAQQAFGSWPEAPVPTPGPPPPPITPEATRIVIVDRPDLGQAQIRIAHEGIARSDPKRIEAALLNVVLGGGGFSSRLMSRVRAAEGLTYSVGSMFDLRRHPGPFGVATFTRVPEVRNVVGLVLDELKRIREAPPEARELANAQSMSTGQFGLGLETSDAVTAALVGLDVYGLPEDALDTYRGRVRAVTGDDLGRLAAERIHPERVGIVVVGPAEALRSQLADLGPVEVVSP